MSCRNLPNPLLVEDILQEVFEWLTVRDRKNAKLVCKVWFDVCNLERFTKNEAFYISLINDYDGVVDVLRNSQRTTLNLNFCSCLLDNDSLPLWRVGGKRIKSLTFNKCTFHLRILPIIFEICVNLIEFRSRYAKFTNNNPKYKNTLNYTQLFGIPTHSVLLPRKKIVRTKLTTFSLQFIHSSFMELRCGQMQRFASFFPDLRILKLRVLIDNEDKILYDFFDVLYSSPFSTWVESLATKLKAVENFDLQFEPRFGESALKPKDLSVFRENNLNHLKQVSLPLDDFILEDNEDLNTIFAFKFWSCFTIDCENEWGTVELSLVAKLIEGNPQLEKLCIRLFTENVAHLGMFFVALVTSRLQSIVIDLPIFDYLDLPENFAAELAPVLEPLPVNTTVRHLEIHHSNRLSDDNSDSDVHSDNSIDSEPERIAVHFCSFCLKYFRNIRYLNAQPGDADVVFKYQTNLKQLEIKLIREPVRPTDTTFVIESLELLDVRPTALDILSAYEFPNLKCVIINDFPMDAFCTYGQTSHLPGLTPRRNHDTEIFIERFNRIALLLKTNVPNVEFLHVVGNPYLLIKAYTVFFKGCLNLPKLRHVSMSIDSEDIVPSEAEVKAEMLKYVPQCASLRTVRIDTSDWSVSLVFNIIDKTFKLSEKHELGNEGQDLNHEFYNRVDLKKFFFHKR